MTGPDLEVAPQMPDEQVPDDLSPEQIEHDDWSEPPDDATRLLATVHRLRCTPIRSLTAEDLRVLLAQQVGQDVLVPRTLARLEQEPLLEGDYYPGDVLAALLRLPPSYWSANPAQPARVERVIASIDDRESGLGADITTFRERVRSNAG